MVINIEMTITFNTLWLYALTHTTLCITLFRISCIFILQILCNILKIILKIIIKTTLM